MVKKITIVVFIILLVSGGALAYEYNGFTKQQPLNQWCQTQIISQGNSHTFGFINFSLFDRKLLPQVVIVVDNSKSSPVIHAFQDLHLPPKHDFSLPLKKNAMNYANIIVVQPPDDVINKIKQANTVRIIFFTDSEQPILCDVPDETLKEWQAKLK